jgi:hypothetical protein
MENFKVGLNVRPASLLVRLFHLHTDLTPLKTILFRNPKSEKVSPH